MVIYCELILVSHPDRIHSYRAFGTSDLPYRMGRQKEGIYLCDRQSGDRLRKG